MESEGVGGSLKPALQTYTSSSPTCPSPPSSFLPSPPRSLIAGSPLGSGTPAPCAVLKKLVVICHFIGGQPLLPSTPFTLKIRIQFSLHRGRPVRPKAALSQKYTRGVDERGATSQYASQYTKTDCFVDTRAQLFQK